MPLRRQCYETGNGFERVRKAVLWEDGVAGSGSGVPSGPGGEYGAAVGTFVA